MTDFGKAQILSGPLRGIQQFRLNTNPNPTLFKSWHWRGNITEEDAGNGVRQVQLSPKVMLETSSPSTGEDRGESDLILPPHSNSLPPGEREPCRSMHRSTSEIFC